MICTVERNKRLRTDRTFKSNRMSPKLHDSKGGLLAEVSMIFFAAILDEHVLYVDMSLVERHAPSIEYNNRSHEHTK